jgi:excinuclease ABC subunit C
VQISEALKNKIGLLPDKSGVYIMRNAGGHIIYIGKAAVLKNRVRQYFFNTQKNQKVAAMVEAVADFDYVITLSEKDALSLEANLVRKHKPHYNILLKDDRHSPYIRIDTNQRFPGLEIVRKIRRGDKAKYFGPFFFGLRAGEIIEIIKSAYKIRACGKLQKGRECLNYHISLCLAPCGGRISEEDYRVAVDKAVAFLSGKDGDAEKIITDKMNSAVENEEFERAITYRDRLSMLKKLRERNLSEFKGGDLDAVSFITDGDYGAISVVIVRGGKLMGAKNYPLFSGEILSGETFSQFLTQYYSDPNTLIPPEILTDTEFDKAALEEYLYSLSGRKTAVAFPKIGAKKKLLTMAEENARNTLVNSMEKETRERGFTQGACEGLSDLLGLGYLKRIECYDISHVSGTEQVASGVVFTDGRPDKKEYRRYNIKSVPGADDFKSLAEVISRRLNRAKIGDASFGLMPDLIVIDGGKGQLSYAHAAMREAGYDIPMISLAEKNEEIFTLNGGGPIVLKKESFVLKLLQRIRDEAHRFAVTFHRNTRIKKRIGSDLEDIRGVGPKKRQILMKSFKSAAAVKAADYDTLRAVEGIDEATARRIYEHFNEKAQI